VQKSDRGCEADAPIPIVFDGEETRRCPRRPIFENPYLFLLAFEHYGHYMKGYLPDEGSLQSQGNRFVRYVSVIRDASSEASAAREEQEKARANRKAAIGSSGG